jgi:hypothetical protein
MTLAMCTVRLGRDSLRTKNANKLQCIAGQGVIIPEVHYGAGKHLNHIPPEHISLGIKYNFITQPLYLWAICFVKQSIGFFLLRIASTAFYRRLIIGIMGMSEHKHARYSKTYWTL